MPHTMEELRQVMAAHGMVSRKNSEKNTSELRTTPTTDKFDYWTWYFEPGNRIRLHDEANGIHINRDNKGIIRFSVDEDRLSSDAPENLYPIYFKTRTFDRFSLSLYSMANFDVAKKALEISKAYVAQIDKLIREYRGVGLYYTSRTKGSGKTYLSTIVGNELTNRGKRVIWYSMPNLLQEIKNSYDRDSGTSTAEIIDRIKQVEILQLDDIGVERQSAWVNETVFSILDYRLLLGKPTLFTSNHMPDELSYDERIIDRIRTMSHIVNLPEENVRRRFAAANDLSKFLGV